MKAIMISIKPQWVAKILNGEKTIEIRKRFPSDYVGWVYIYCTKDKELLHKNCANIYWIEDKYFKAKNKKIGTKTQPCLNGKVVARFWCDEIEYIEDGDFKNFNYISYCLDSFRNTISAFSCLSIEQINAYLKGKDGYAIHIGKLEIFDKPKELSEFKSYKKNIVHTKINGMVFETELDNSLIKAPQSWCYIEV